MKICFLIFLLFFAFIKNIGAEEFDYSFKHYHDIKNTQNDSSFIDELENQLQTNLTWLNPLQLDVLNDLKTDGYNTTELQKEIILFYNLTTGFQRKNAAYHLTNSCLNLYSNFTYDNTSEEFNEEVFIHFWSNEPTSFNDLLKLLYEVTNETELVELFMDGCFPFFNTEAPEFITQFFDMEEKEKDVERYNKILINQPNGSTNIKFYKAKKLFDLLQVDEALALYVEIGALKPNKTEFIEEYADALTFLGDFDKAIKLYDRILKMEPENIKVLDKKLNALIKHTDQNYDNANEIIFDKHFNPHLKWLNEVQKRELRRLKAEGKISPELFAKVSEFFESSNETIKAAAINSMEHGCIHLLYTVFGYEKAEEVLALRENSSEIFERKYSESFNNIKGEGQTRIAATYTPFCRKILSFDQENIPRIMISPKINGKIFEFIFDTGAAVTMANEEVWEAIGKPYLHPFNKSIRGIGGRARTMGRCRVNVGIHGKTTREWLYIIEDGMLLFGRNWIDSLKIKIEH